MLPLTPFLLCAFAYFIATASSAASNPFHSATRSRKRCTSLSIRYEWRDLEPADKKGYIRAIQCLQRLPARNVIQPNIRTRFDEFQAIHIALADKVHIVGHFLPWHRHFTVLHAKVLRDECHYHGPIPYWNWSKDADSLKPMHLSPIFDPVTGFGGDGGPSGTYILPLDTANTSRIDLSAFTKGCVETGPFASYTLRNGPGKMVTDHCLVRNINDTYKGPLTSEAVASVAQQPTFERFRIELEGRPVTRTPRMHDAGHVLVGGDMSNFYSSVGDPLFFLHHANLDRIWWEWQLADPKNRLYQISGRSSANPPYENVTLDFLLKFDSFAPAIPLREVMDIHSGPSCYSYDTVLDLQSAGTVHAN